MLRLLRLLVPVLVVLLGSLLFLGQFRAVQAQSAPQAAGDTGDPVIVAAGDIANCINEEDFLTAYLIDAIDGPVLALGDLAYEAGSPAEFRDCYDPAWGRLKERTRPVPGNHEYGTQGAEGYFSYFGDIASPREPGCTRDCQGYYSYDLGAWHLIALNSEIAMNAGSPQEQWLRADLAAHPTECTLAYWHRPRFSSTRPNNVVAHDLFQALYDYGADVLLVGHDHVYERFAPTGPSGQLEQERGIREFVVGTGGAPLYDFRFIQPTSEVREHETWGVLKMTLRPTSYDWEFIPIPGQTFTDSGSAPCVSAPSLPAAPAPVAATGEVTGTTVASAPGGSAAAAAGEQAVLAAQSVQQSTQEATALPAAGESDYTVVAGDTLSGIAVRFGLDWTVLAAANNMAEDDFLQIGQVLQIPGAAGSVARVQSAAAQQDDAGGTAAGNASVAAPTPAPSATAGMRVHVVAAGDTIFAIALANGLDWQALLRLNGLEEDAILQIGQRVQLP